MLDWKGVVHSYRSLPLYRRCSVLSSGARLLLFRPAGLFMVDNPSVVRSVARLLDHGGQSKPLPLVMDGGLGAIVRQMILARFG